MGTRDAGTAMGLSEFASRPAAEVARVNPSLFFQVHWSADRDALLERAEIARTAGARALIVTLDWSFPAGRDWGSPAIPERLDLPALIRLAPDGSRQTLLDDGLVSPAAVAVGRNGSIYISNHGQEAGLGEVLRFRPS